MNLGSAINIEDLHRIARRKLPRIIFDYIEGGVEDEHGLSRNEAAFQKHRLLPRYLVDVSKRDQSATLFGRTYASPFGISPTGGVGLYRREGEVMLAEAAAAANVPYIMSGGSNASMEEALRVAPNNVWFQLYAAKDASITDALIGRARDCGAGALVLTVDVPVHPKRERNYRNGFARVRGGGVLESLKLKPSILLEAMTHPAWVIEYMRLGGAPTLGNWAPHAPNGASTSDVIALGRSQTPASAQTWRGPRALPPPVSACARRQGHPEPGRRGSRRGNRGRRHHRLEPWRPPARPGARLARGVAGDQGGGRRQSHCDARQRRAARRRYSDRACASAPNSCFSVAPRSTAPSPAGSPASRKRSTSSAARSTSSWARSAARASTSSAPTSCGATTGPRTASDRLVVPVNPRRHAPLPAPPLPV